MYTAVGKSPPLSFRSLTEGLCVPSRNSTAAPSYTKAGLWMISSAGPTSSHMPPSSSQRAAATGGGTYSWMGQKSGRSAGPMKLHSKTTKLPRLVQFQTFTLQPRQADTDV